MRNNPLFQKIKLLLQPAPILGAVITSVFWIGLAYQLSVERSKAVDTAVERGSGAARLFEESTIRLIKGVDRALLLMRLAYEENPERFDLVRLVERTSLIGDLTIQASLIGPDGYMKSSSTEYSGPPLYLGDREHFIFPANAKTDDLFIGKPILGRASGKLSIPLSRRLSKPDGSFDGVIVASIDPEFVNEFYHSIKSGIKVTLACVGWMASFVRPTVSQPSQSV